MTSFKWYTEFVRKNAEGIRSVNVNVNDIFAVSVNMALSMFILEKHFFVVISAIIFSDRNERTANSHIALTSMLFVKIPWAHTRVHVMQSCCLLLNYPINFLLFSLSSPFSII